MTSTLVDERRHVNNYNGRSGTLAAVLADRINYTVDRSGLSRRKLCLAAGVSHSYLTFVLDSLKKDPHAAPFAVEKLRAVAITAGVSPHWLITGQGSPDDRDGPELPPPGRAFGELEQWPDLLTRAREIAPHLPGWTWERIATMTPVLSAPPTPVMLAELATWMHRHETVTKPAPETGVRRTA